MIGKISRSAISLYNKVNRFRIYLSIFNIKETLIFVRRTKKNSSVSFTLHPKELEHKIKIRSHPIDKSVIRYVLYEKYHLPLQMFHLPQNATVVDLGVNIGLTVAHIKTIYPKVKIIGYEMDLNNYELALWNTQYYSDVEIINKAIWVENKRVKYNKKSNPDGYRIQDLSIDKNDTEIEAITMREMIKEHSIEKIDYLKMDIEGAEKNILKDNDLEWLHIVNSMNIEMHLDGNENINEYIEIIRNYNFTVWKDTKHHSTIMATKNRK
ncbi:FkbM family methyltransferase [Tenacibaculum sp.]|nr:FkbM family methyltransferase [Tenacibaculum sp.]